DRREGDVRRPAAAGDDPDGGNGWRGAQGKRLHGTGDADTALRTAREVVVTEDRQGGARRRRQRHAGASAAHRHVRATAGPQVDDDVGSGVVAAGGERVERVDEQAVLI